MIRLQPAAASEGEDNRIKPFYIADRNAFRAVRMALHHRYPVDRMLAAHAQMKLLIRLSSGQQLQLDKIDIR